MIYVSDLDGTLLDSRGELSAYTTGILNKLMNEGLRFTIASARSIFTASGYIDELDFNIPVILRNGAFVYDPSDRKVLMKKLMSRSQMDPLIDFFINEGLNPIVHHSNNGSLFVDYTNISNYGEKYYIESRLKAGDRRFRNVSTYEYGSDSEFISMCVIGTVGDQDEMYEKVTENFPDGYIIHKYVDNYSHHTWIEVSHLEATKENAISFILDYLDEDGFVAFGDNINDLGMLNAADKGYIPAESYLHKAGKAFELTRSNDEDGVARKLVEILK